jgi:hypothetical protein
MLASAAAGRTCHAAYKADPPLDAAPFLHMNRWGARINGGAWSDRGTWISDEVIGGKAVTGWIAQVAASMGRGGGRLLDPGPVVWGRGTLGRGV